MSFTSQRVTLIHEKRSRYDKDYLRFVTKLSVEIMLGFTILQMKVLVYLLIILREISNRLKLLICTISTDVFSC